MPEVEIVSIGTELLLGQLVDSNSAHVAQALADCGVDVHAKHTLGDNRERIAAYVADALDRVDGIVTTGGLGPTVDDLTKEAVCDALGVGTVLHEPSLRNIEAIFRSFAREMPPNNVKQAELPTGARVLANPNGTAPGFIAFRWDAKFVACMPGPPREMKPMLADQLVPWLRERFALDSAIYTRVIHTIGIGESDIDRRIDDLFRTSENPKIAVLAHDFRADVKIMAKAHSAREAEAAIEPLQEEVERRLDGFVFGNDAATPESAVLGLLRERRLTLALAESCTGGRIAAALTSVPGASKGFLGGIVAYDNALKVGELGVSAATIDGHGSVSEETCKAMARGARERFGSDVALAVTGIAGPDGGTPEKPVGLVWFAFAAADGERAWKFTFRGDRAAIQGRATTYGLGTLWRHLTSPGRQLP